MSDAKHLWPEILFGLVTSLLSGAAFSTDLLTVFQLAQKYDKTFSAARNDYEAVKQTQRQAKGLYYPNLAVRYERTETDQEINRSDNEVFGSGKSDFPTDDVLLSLTQPIFRWDYFSQRKVAKAEVRQAEYQFTAAEQDLMLRTAEAYLLSLAASDNEFVTRAELDSMVQQLKLAQKRLEVGLGNATEVHESIARVEFTQSEVIASENAVVDRQEELRTIIGEALGDLLPLRDDFRMKTPDPADPDMWIEQASKNNLALQARDAALEVATAEYKLQKADRYPTLGLVADFNNRDTGGSLFGGGSDVDTTDITLRAEWTIFQGGILHARIKEALYKMQSAQDGLELERRNVRRDTRNAYLGVVSSIAKAKALKSSLDAQELTVKAKQKGFETGANSNLEVLDAKRDFFFVQRDYLRARYDYLLSLLNLKRQVGSLSPDDLGMINGLLKTASVNNVSGLKQAQAVRLPEAVTSDPAGSMDDLNAGASVGTAATQTVPAQAETHQASIDQAPEPGVNVVVVVNTLEASDIAADETSTDMMPPDAQSSREIITGTAGSGIDSVPKRRQIVSYLWLFEQPQDHYSIQVASVDAETKAVDYITENNVPDAYYFQSKGNVRDWYFIVSGSYSDPRAAQKAANALGMHQVWIRKISELRTGRCRVAAGQPEVIPQRIMQFCIDSGLESDLGRS